MEADNNQGGGTGYGGPGNGMTMEQFVNNVNTLLNSPFGGHGDQNGYNFFLKASYGFWAGYAYNDYHDSWGETFAGSRENAVERFNSYQNEQKEISKSIHQVAFFSPVKGYPGSIDVMRFLTINYVGGKPPDYVGVSFKFQYLRGSSDPKYSDYNWIYHKRYGSSKDGGASLIVTDPNNNVNTGPFYYGNGYEYDTSVISKNDIFSPSSTIFSFSDITLYGKQGNDWIEIGTINFGFSYESGRFTAYNPVITYKGR